MTRSGLLRVSCVNSIVPPLFNLYTDGENDSYAARTTRTTAEPSRGNQSEFQSARLDVSSMYEASSKRRAIVGDSSCSSKGARTDYYSRVPDKVWEYSLF
jgi:hypothetical protein